MKMADMKNREVKIGVRTGFEICLCAVFLAVTVPAAPQPETLTVQSELGVDQVEDRIIEPQPADSQVIEAEDQGSVEQQKSAELVPRRTILGREQILRINRSLKRAIEQNRRLAEERARMEAELRSLRGERRFEKNEIVDVRQENTALKERAQELAREKERLDRRAQELQQNLSQSEQQWQRRLEQLEQQMARRAEKGRDQARAEVKEQPARMPEHGQSPSPAEEAVSPDQQDLGEVLVDQETGMELIALLDDLDQTKDEMAAQEAMVHYNMGNIFYHQGRYAKAAEEYRRAVEIDPAMTNAHFNLAFVAGDFLDDYATAVEHYHQYLYLNPGAEDAALVQEKLVEAKLELRVQIDDFTIDKDVLENRGKNYHW
ncbi:MAG: tetratricopeptide repeat protein [Candidatus Omnitrophota bacterium]